MPAPIPEILSRKTTTLEKTLTLWCPKLVGNRSVDIYKSISTRYPKGRYIDLFRMPLKPQALYCLDEHTRMYYPLPQTVTCRRNRAECAYEQIPYIQYSMR